MLLYYFFQILTKAVLWASDNSKVGCGPPWKSNWNLKLQESRVVDGFLHLLEDNALLHLSNILFFNHSHKMLKGGVYLVRVEFITLSDTLAQEVVAAFF